VPVLARFNPPSSPGTNSNNAAAASPHEKPARTRGGKEKARHREAAFLYDRMLGQAAHRKALRAALLWRG